MSGRSSFSNARNLNATPISVFLFRPNEWTSIPEARNCEAICIRSIIEHMTCSYWSLLNRGSPSSIPCCAPPTSKLVIKWSTLIRSGLDRVAVNFEEMMLIGLSKCNTKRLRPRFETDQIPKSNSMTVAPWAMFFNHGFDEIGSNYFENFWVGRQN